ncbi:hypothetical protein J6590_099665 [Homalodisca vitripennis]|nr:hypothetical protein J6590_099665 [Homalodisca vitripennis]
MHAWLEAEVLTCVGHWAGSDPSRITASGYQGRERDEYRVETLHTKINNRKKKIREKRVQAYPRAAWSTVQAL